MKKIKVSKKELQFMVANAIHEDWRSHRNPGKESQYEPRFKPTTDTGWIEKHGTDQVDIANTPFAELPSDWQKENLNAADIAIDIAQKGETDIENGSRLIHVTWRDRNRDTAEAVQLLDYDDPNFPEWQRQLDRNVFTITLKVCESFEVKR